MREKDDRTYSLAAILSVGIWGDLGTLAIVLDGFLTPVLAQRYVAASEGTRQLAATIFEYNLLLTGIFLGPALLAYALGISLFGASLVRAKLYNKWFAVAGVVIGLIGVLRYVAGIFGPYPHWVLGPAFTPYIIVVSIWVFVLGVFHYRGREVPTVPGKS